MTPRGQVSGLQFGMGPTDLSERASAPRLQIDAWLFAVVSFFRGDTWGYMGILYMEEYTHQREMEHHVV